MARIVWVFPATYIPRLISAEVRARDPSPPKKAVFVISWAGMRGAVSLAAALALPLDPVAFPQRDLMIFLAFCVIIATLVGQGLTLPWLVRRLGVVATTRAGRRGDACAPGAVEAALNRLDELADEYPGHLELVEQMKQRYDHEASHIWPHAEGPRDEAEQEALDHLEIRDRGPRRRARGGHPAA